MKRQDRKSQLTLLDNAFYRLERCCESTSEWNKYLALHEAEERDHRQFKPDHIQCGLTRGQAVRLFAVKEIFERFGMPRICICGHKGPELICPVPGCERETRPLAIFTPSAEEFFHIRKSIFGAVAMVKLCSERILAEFDRAEMVRWLSSVDYVALNKDPRQAQEAAA